MKNQEPIKKCPHCGASMKGYWHRLSPGLVGSLIKAIEAVKRKRQNSIHLSKDLSLSHTEHANFQKLRFHGLVAKVDNSGSWLITSRGGQFLRGEIEVPMKVFTYRNAVKEHSIEKTHIRNYRNKFPEFETEFAYEYQKPVGINAPTQEKLL